MFTGIIEVVGEISDLKLEGTNRHFRVSSSISTQLKVDQSLSHNGVCLTVTEIEGNTHWCTAIDETLKKSNLGLLKKGDWVNLERCLLNNGRFDGHIVQGHVDQQGKVKSIRDERGSWLFTFNYDPSSGNITVEKGSICVNGVSLTCFASKDGEFTVAIIPYTFENTNFKQLRVGDAVNLEFDIIGKYVKKLLAMGEHR
jgi:riboflavin synthase